MRKEQGGPGTEERCPRVLRGNDRWVLSGFSVGSPKMKNFKKLTKIISKKEQKKSKKKKRRLSIIIMIIIQKDRYTQYCTYSTKKLNRHTTCRLGARLSGFSVGSQWVLTGYSAGTQ